jgi:hypothetical protein
MGALDYLQAHFQPKGYILYASIISIGGFLNGYIIFPIVFTISNNRITAMIPAQSEL